MHEFTVHAPAKLNLYLDVLGQRQDGYHNIKTLFEKIDLKDEIVIRERHKGIEVKVEPPAAGPSGKGNIVYRAAKALLEEIDADLGLEIIVRKHIPVSAGLGGGSSDAASALRSINKEFELGVSDESLFSIAGKAGADVGFFMLDSPFAVGSGRGDELEPVDTDCSFAHVIIKPDISIETARMYKKLDTCNRRCSGFKIENAVSSIKNKDIPSLTKSCYNIFEEILGEADDIDRGKGLLSQAAGGPVFLSGSGPSVFCIVRDRGEAMKIADRIPKETGFKVFVAETNAGGIYGDYRG